MTRQDAVAAVILTASLATWAAMCSAPAKAADTVPFVVALDQPAVDVPVPFAEQAAARAHCESTWRARAVNPSGATGLYQIMPVHTKRIERLGYSWPDMLDPVANTRIAIDIWREQSWRPWTSSDACVSRLTPGP